ncbi:hypothetical protein PR048_007067 [Dryococelus australis]|uniref:Uncharacterized protein n=1 Tax=Dryococelus australis TaxID=614101 RepID=A0ABQ9IDX4_9NEOP|nr:hypothetical protein PR048_007067 [Dryococelus australis]
MLHQAVKVVYTRVGCIPEARATVAERLDCSPLTKVNRVQAPGRVTGFSQVGIVPDDSGGRRVFGFSRGFPLFPRPFSPVLLHTHINCTQHSSNITTVVIGRWLAVLTFEQGITCAEERYLAPRESNKRSGRPRFSGRCCVETESLPCRRMIHGAAGAEVAGGQSTAIVLTLGYTSVAEATGMRANVGWAGPATKILQRFRLHDMPRTMDVSTDLDCADQLLG